jgi:phosphoglycolate phosphatase-like HAD superfamily hydrolase
MIRLALFDIDGTLARTGGAGVKAFGKVFETEFKVVDGFEKLKFSGRTDVSIVREFFDFHRILARPDNFQRFYERYVFWLDHILKDSHCEVIPGVWDFIRGLQALPEPPLLGLLTGNIRLGAEIKLRRIGLWEIFATGAFADDAEERDRIAAVARERGNRLLGGNLRDDEVLVIGDTPLDIRCGRAIAAKVLAVATGGAELQELKAHQPDWAVADLREATAREIVYGSASEAPATVARNR